MSSFFVVKDPSWPDLAQWAKVEKMTWAECDASDYFSDWGRRWGDDVAQGNTLYRTKETLKIPDWGEIRLAYLVRVTLSTDAPDIKATNDYIQHQENLCYPVPWGTNIDGRARFIGAKIAHGQTELFFVISDPELDKVIFKHEADELSRLLN